MSQTQQADTAPDRVTADGVREGLRRGIGPAAATFVFGLSYGATAAAAGWGVVAPLAFSALAFAGSAQFLLLVTLAGGFVPAVTAAVLMNVRYLVMSVALNHSLRGGRWLRALQAQALADASFAVAHRGHGRFDRSLLIGSCLPQWLAWVSGSAVGLVAAPSPATMTELGLDVAFPAFFLLLAIDEMRTSRPAIPAALLGALLAGVALVALPSSLALLVALAGALVGLRSGPDRTELAA